MVAKYVKEQHKYWVATRTNEVSGDNKVRRFRIGLDERGYALSTPLARDYENRWDFHLRDPIHAE